jgi:hypothetical protein
MSPTGQWLWSVVSAARRRVRRDALLATLGIVGAVVPVALVLAWGLGTRPAWSAPSPVPLVLEVVAGVVAGLLAWWLGRRWVGGINDDGIAAAAERWRGLPAGSVRGVLELSRELPAGVSPALYRHAESRLAMELAGATPVDLSGELGVQARRRRQRVLFAFSGLSALVVALGLATPERSRQAWAPLLNPIEHLVPAPLPPLAVEPGDVEVPRGSGVEVRIEAPGRSEVVLRWRAAGDVPRQRTLEVVDGRAATRLAPIDAPLQYWVVAPDGARSDTFRIRPLDPLLMSDLVVDVIYPSYLNRPAERFEGEVPPLELPLGTELQIRGRATRRLREVALVRQDGTARVPLVVTAERFAGRWKPRTSGVYHWSFSGEGAAEPADVPPPLELTVVGDAAPEVEVIFPGTDTILGPELQQPLVADASDDHGLRSATLVSWRVSALGEREAPVEQALPLEGGLERAVIRGVLDARERRLLPGDTLYYFIRVVDTSPAGQVGVSRTYRLRLPGMGETRERAEEEARSVIEEAAKLAQEAKQLQDEMRNFQRRNARRSASSARAGQVGRSPTQGAQAGTRGGRSESLDYRQAEQARQLLERQEALVERMEALRQRTEELQRTMEAAGLRDPELQQRMQELSQLYEQILTPELKQKMEELRQALAQLDPEKVQAALEQLAQQQEALRRQLEQSLDLLRRAAAEQQLNALAQQARELAAQQQALAEAMKQEGAGSAERAEQQAELAERTDSLQQRLEQLEQQLKQLGETQAAAQMGAAAQQAQQAQRAMERAAQQARQQQGQQAAQSGEQAAQQLEQMAASLDGTRQAMAEAWKQETRQAVDQATQEALEMAQRQNALLQQMQQMQQRGTPASSEELQQLRAEQAALQEGLEQLGENLSQAGQRSAHINRDVGAALGRAMLSMRQTQQALERSDAGQRLPIQQAAQTVDALNRLALELSQNGQQIQQAQSGTGLQEALEQLAELAKQQGSLSGQASALLPLNLSPQAMAGRLQDLARRQKEIAEKLGGMNNEVGGRDDLLGRLDQLAEEADQIARELSGGRLTPELVARQERLFHRLLDAGRTLERDEVSEERVAERPGDVPPSRPGPLDPALLAGGPRFQTPGPEELRMLPPAYRRLILEYFDRLNRREDAAGGRRGTR